MREINVNQIEEMLKKACGEIAVNYSPDLKAALLQAEQNETSTLAENAMQMLLQNAEIACRENIPICQDTGMAIVYVKAGQEVHFTGGSLKEAIQKGVAEGYRENYLRASIVDDPLYDRKNTGNNTPALVYYEITDGDQIEISLMAKGFGSENKSAVKMLTPADGEQGVIDFVMDTVKKAGPNACPPFVIGVGIGSSFDGAAVLSKKALLRPISQSNPDERYRKLEDVLLQKINETGIGPWGLHGNTTALKIQIEEAPTHIAGLPVAVNMCCHACRHWKGTL